MLKWRRRKWPRLLWLFLFQRRKGRKGPFSAKGYYNFLIWCNKLWVLLHNRPQKFTAMAVGAALVEWEEPWITLICKLREKNVERDSQHTVETSLFIFQMTTSWNKQQNLITIVIHQDYQPQPLCLFTASFDSYSAFLLSFSNYFFLFTKKTKLFSVFLQSFLPSSPVNFLVNLLVST